MDENMEYVSVDASVIGIKKPIMVAESMRNQRAALTILKDIAQVEADSKIAEKQAASDSSDDEFGGAFMKGVYANLEFMDKVTEYVTKTLGLTKKQADALEDLSMNAMSEFVGMVAATVMGMDTGQVTEDDQKSDDI